MIIFRRKQNAFEWSSDNPDDWRLSTYEAGNLWKNTFFLKLITWAICSCVLIVEKLIPYKRPPYDHHGVNFQHSPQCISQEFVVRVQCEWHRVCKGAPYLPMRVSPFSRNCNKAPSIFVGVCAMHLLKYDLVIPHSGNFQTETQRSIQPRHSWNWIVNWWKIAHTLQDVIW